jgi:hypothetical protein
MSAAGRTLGAVGLLAGIGLASMLSLSASGAGESAPIRVTTDTAEYCRELGDLVARTLGSTSAPPSPDVEELSGEGRRMCEKGEVRGGILRLRRAFVLLQMSESAP